VQSLKKINTIKAQDIRVRQYNFDLKKILMAATHPTNHTKAYFHIIDGVNKPCCHWHHINARLRKKYCARRM
jgi:hypothetical protein